MPETSESSKQEGEFSEDEKIEIAQHIDEVKKLLQHGVGVEDLSMAEGTELRHITEDCYREYKEIRDSLGGKDLGRSPHIFNIEEEAMVRWFYRTFGIQYNEDIPQVFIIKDDTTGETWKYEKLEEEAVNNKKDEILKKGHKYTENTTIPNDFKEYIRRLREKSIRP